MPWHPSEKKTINELEKKDMVVYLTTYARQYMLNYKSDYFQTADLPKIRNQLLRSSIELRSVLSSKPPSTLDANTTNEQLYKISMNTAEELLRKYVSENNITIDMEHALSRGIHTIQECQKIRDQLRKDLGLPPMLAMQASTPSWKKPKQKVNRAESDFYRSTFNLRGCDLNKFLQNHSAIVDTRARMTEEGANYSTPNFKENDFYVRALVPMSINTHIPTLVKKTFRALQQADPTFLLKPFDRSEKSFNVDISNDSNIPNDEKEYAKYIQGTSTTKANKLRFSMRVTNTITFKQLRALLTDYENETGTRFSYDKIVSRTIFSAGYLQYLHPKWINRDELLEWLLEQTDDEKMAEKIHIYPRKFWNNATDGTPRTDTEIVVIDGSFDNKKEVLEFLYNIEWNGKYSMVNFVPWHTSNEFTKEDQVEALRNHNEYMSTLTSEVLKIKNPGTILETADSGDLTIAKWMETKTFQNVPIFYSAEKIGAVEILITYSKANLEIVNDLLNQLPQILSDDFDNTKIQAVFGPNFNGTIKRIKPKNVRSHMSNLKQKMSNPQSTDDDSILPKVNTFYGRPPVRNSQVEKSEIKVEKSFAQATASLNNDQHTPTEINQLTTMLNELRKDHNQLKKSLKSNVTTSVLQEVDTRLENMEIKMNTKIDESKKEWDKQLNTFFTQFRNENQTERELQKKKDDEFRKSLIAAVSSKNKPDDNDSETPSGDDCSARGGAK